MKPLFSSLSLRLGIGFVLLAVIGPQVRAQGESSGVIPNECCPETKISNLNSVWPREFDDAGSGSTTISVYGAATRHLPYPVAQDGMRGLARLYHATLQFDASYTAWDGTDDSLKGGPDVRPNMDAANLAEGAAAVQPRPGTMPGLYLYDDYGTDSYYHYGGPVDSGASPSSTAVYGPPPPSFGGTTIRTNNLSGAQLWHYGAATPNYIEIKHVDGTIARFDWFNPFVWVPTPPGPPGKLWRLTQVRDPYDNVASYVYDGLHRLIRIEFPSGLKQHFTYNPAWPGWSWGAISPSGLEISYTQGTSTTPLPGMTWGTAFSNVTGTPRGSHFGSNLSRTYSAPRRVIKDSQGQPYSISGSSTVTGQIVHSFAYDTIARTLTETQSVHVGTPFASPLTTDAGLPDRPILLTSYSMNTDRRVIGQQQLMTGAAIAVSYTSVGVRTTDLQDLPSGATLTATVVQAFVQVGTQTNPAELRRFEYYFPTGRVYSVIHTPSNDFFGRPRASHATGENSTIGGVAVSDVEPEKITSYRIFDASCACQKPIEVREIATLGGTDHTRTTTFEYFVDSKLLKKRTELNPATTPLPQPSTLSWEYTYVRAMTGAQAWGAWLPDTEITPDGTYSYIYTNWVARADASNHGQIPGKTERRIDNVRIQGALDQGGSTTSTSISESVTRNFPPQAGVVRGQPGTIVDGDGITTTLSYTTEGWLETVIEHGGQTKRTYAFDVAGNVTTINDNVDSTGLRIITNFPDQSGSGVVYAANTTSGGLLRASEAYYDRFAHLAVSRQNNLDSTGAKPSKHLGSGAAARDWIESQYHFKHHQLIEVYQDRKPLDQAGGVGQFVQTTYEYHSNGRLNQSLNPNGSKTQFDFDGFGTLYRSVTRDPSNAMSVTSAKTFVNPFLEVTGSYENTGTDKLWTVLVRNTAGAIIQINEPWMVTVPSGYTASTGGAVHQFEIDVMGRVVEARAYSGVGGTLLTKREIHHDQLDRQIWQHDLVLGFGTGDQYMAWRYRAAKATQMQTVERTGIAAQTYTYWDGSGFLKSIRDGFVSTAGTGNVVDYAYHANTTYLQQITRTDLEPGSGARITTTAYDVDPFGRVIKIRDGSPALEYDYAYNSFGGVDRYTDPLDRVQKFLPDGFGRIVEHVHVGDAPDYIRNSTTFEDSGAADGRTKVSRLDGLGNVTITHADFAGRPFIVQNPGGDVAPTPSAKNQSMCLYAEYDAASRITAVYDGDGGKTQFWRDGPGRVIQRELAVTGANIATWNTRDVLRRDAIGRLFETNLWGSNATPGGIPNHAIAVGVEQFDQDSLGRTHEERFQFAFASGNVLEVQSGFSGGNPHRQNLGYADNLSAPLSAPLSMQYTTDVIGRLTGIDWTGSSGMTNLGGYEWVGGLRRGRTVNYDTTGKQGKTSYGYDSYGRLLLIQDDVYTTSWATKNKFEYEYDAASNLTKEEYTKVNGSVGDRFAYDAYHRLAKGWMGVTQTTMDGPEPAGWIPGQMHEYLTYGLDGANNRTTSVSQTGSTPQTTNYTVQDSAHAQGPSNRYDVVGPTTAPVVHDYDSRGNLSYDGVFHYRYDFMNRLQEVWRVIPTDGAPAGDDSFAVLQQTAIEGSTEEVKEEVPDLMQRLPREHMDPVFRNRLKARLVGGVMRLSPTPQGGGGMAWWFSSDANLELIAVYAYDAFNRRIMSVIVGVETQFHTWDGWRQVAQFAPDYTGWPAVKAVPTKQFVWGSGLDELLSYRRKNGSVWENYFVLHGGQDTAAKLVNSSGAVVEQYEYDPYGKATVYTWSGSAWVSSAVSQYGLPFLWKSIRLDSETGLLYMRNRYYSTTLGRFLTQDPLGTWGDGLNGGNGYGYVGCRPLDFGDPTGEQGWMGSIIGGIIGGVSAYATGGNVWAGIGGGIVGGFIGNYSAGVAMAAASGAASGAAGAVAGKMIENCMDGKPVLEGCLEAGTEGALLGGLMGGVAGKWAKPKPKRPAKPPAEPPVPEPPTPPTPPTPPEPPTTPGPKVPDFDPFKDLDPNRLEAVFRPGELADHFGEHGVEWANGITQAEYLQKAQDLLFAKPGGHVLSHVRNGGDLLRYNTLSNEFAVMSPGGTIRTLFRPKRGMAYWLGLTR